MRRANAGVLGLAVGASESEAFWSEFLRSLAGRGLKGVQLVISDHHLGLKAAVSKVLSGATWQRCRVHFMRNLLAYVPQRDKSMIAALVRMVFAQPNREAAGQQLAETVKAMQPRWPKAAEVLRRPRTTSWPTWLSPWSTGRASTRRTRWNG